MGLTFSQLLKNSAWTFLELILYPALMILATPVFISSLGIAQYGVWMLVANIAMGINLFNVGVGDSTIRLISAQRSANDRGAIRRIFCFNFTLALALCLLAVASGVFFYFSGFVTFFYNGQYPAAAGKLLMLACVSTGLKFIEISLVSVFKAFERFDISSRLIMLSRNSVLLVNLVLAATGHDLVEMFLSTIIVNAMNVAVQILVVSRFNSGFLGSPRLYFSREQVLFLNYNFWYWCQNAIGLLGFLADKLVVAKFTDEKTLGYYSVATLIGTQIHNFFMAFGAFFFPRVSMRIATERFISPLYFSARSLVAIPGWLLISLLLLFGDQVFSLWLGPATYAGSITYIKLYLVFEAALLLIIVPFHFINGTTFIRLNSIFELVIRGSHVVAMFAGYYFGGVNGIIYGLIFSTLLNIPFQYFYFHRSIMPELDKAQFAWVVVPVLALLGLAMTGNVFFKLSLFLCLIVTAKYIYFDPARQHAKDLFAALNLSGRLQGK